MSRNLTDRCACLLHFLSAKLSGFAFPVHLLHVTPRCALQVGDSTQIYLLSSPSFSPVYRHFSKQHIHLFVESAYQAHRNHRETYFTLLSLSFQVNDILMLEEVSAAIELVVRGE